MSETSSAPSTPAEPLRLKLQIVSPNLPTPLQFLSVPPAATIKQLKAKIRDALPSSPADDDQRLIFNGRVLARETDTLATIFGEETLHDNDQKTIHLVIKEGAAHRAPTPARAQSPATSQLPRRVPTPLSTARDQSPAPGSRSASSTRPPSNPLIPPGFARRPANFPQRMPSPSPTANATPEQAAAFHEQHQNLSGWLTNVQRGAAQAMASNAQRGRSPFSMPRTASASQGPENRSSSIPAGTTHREFFGPDGQKYRVETTVRPMASAGLSPTRAQQVLQGLDQRDALRASQQATPAPRSDQVVPTPAPTSVPRPQESTAGQTAPRSNMDVYLLSSPDGPRGILVNNSTSQAFYTPMLRPRARDQGHLAARVRELEQLREEETRELRALRDLLGHQRQTPRPQPQEPPIGLGHPRNPAQAGWGPILMALVPHLWLLARLAFFVWIITAPGVSYSRWVAVVSIALLVFIISTGLLNNIAGQVWRPIGRQVENFLPAIDRRAGIQHRQEEGNPPPDADANPDPAQAAARWVAQRQRDGWLTAQLRQLQRAGLLFLASIAPGVAERHIENIEAAARAARAEREARERAAREAAEAARAAEQQEGEEGEGSTTNEHAETRDEQADRERTGEERSEERPGAQREAPRELVDVGN